jgi:hypothetical protein
MNPKNKEEKTLNIKTLTLEDETPKVLWAPRWLVDTSTSWGHNFCIQSPFGVHMIAHWKELFQGLQLLVGAKECHGNPWPPECPKNII